MKRDYEERRNMRIEKEYEKRYYVKKECEERL